MPDLDHLTAELGDEAEGIRSLHQGGEDHWPTLVEQTVSRCWLDYPGLSPNQVAAHPKNPHWCSPAIATELIPRSICRSPSTAP